MNVAEVTSVLKGISQVKDFYEIDEDRVGAWSVILDSDMEYAWAMRYLAKLLGESRRTPEPSDFNIEWRAVKAARAEREFNERFKALPASSVEPDPEYREAMIKKCREDMAKIGRKV